MHKQLPPRPSLEQLKKQAKFLLKEFQAANPEALNRIREQHSRWRNSSEPPIAKSRFTLADAQLVLAKEYGFETWSRLKAHLIVLNVAPSYEATVRSIRDAAGQGDLKRLNALLEAHPELIDEPGGPGVRTALHQAVFGAQADAVKLLLERGADPNVRCEGDNAYPLHFAAERKNFPIIRLLIEHGADPVGEGDYHELGVIGWATAWDYVNADREIVDYLLAHGARHNIFSAVAMGEVELIGDLVARSPADLERRMDMTNRRRRPLHLAVIKKQPKALTTLLELGANMESLDEAGFTALDQAALNGEAEMAQALLERGARIRLPGAIALQKNREIEKLLAKDPHSLKPGGRWGHLIVRASEHAVGEVIETLIRAGASVAVRDDPKTAIDSTWGYTPLHAAAFRGNLSAASVLLKHGANVRTREEKYHGTPAGWADHAGHTEVRDLILREPVDIMEAIEYGLTERVLAILQQDPDAIRRSFQDYPLFPLYAEGWFTPLVFAVSFGQTDMVRLLLDQGADGMIRSPEGRTLVEMALEKGHRGVADILKAHASNE
jgi:ankyrin repeat protein